MAVKEVLSAVSGALTMLSATTGQEAMGGAQQLTNSVSVQLTNDAQDKMRALRMEQTNKRLAIQQQQADTNRMFVKNMSTPVGAMVSTLTNESVRNNEIQPPFISN